MKKIFLTTVGFLAATALTLTSCNKKDIEELQSKTDEQNTNIQVLDDVITQGDGIALSVNGNRGIDSVAFSFSRTYTYMSSSHHKVSYVYDNGNGTYDFYIERSDDITEEDYCEITIEDYNPTIGASSASAYVYLEAQHEANDINSTLDFWQQGYSYCCGNQVEINSISFNEDTREFSVSLTMTSIDEDGYSSTDNPVTTTISFSGTLSWENTVSKMSK